MTLILQQNVNLQSFNTLGVAAHAKEFLCLDQIYQCAELPALCRDKSVLVLGGGSNVVLAGDFSGLVVLNRLQGIEVLERDNSCVRVKVAGGENWDHFVAYALERGWYGLENLSAIPGSVGAAPVQNIGAYGVELKAFVEAVGLIHLADGRQQSLANDECQFGYRDSIFKSTLKNQCLITHVVFKLPLKPDMQLDYGEIRAAMTEQGLTETSITPIQLRQIITQIRARKLPDPAQLPNVGSFFKNPVVSLAKLAELQQRWADIVFYRLESGDAKIAAGWLLDRLGWKGKQQGSAKVHERQALVLINLGHSATDIIGLKNAILEDVLAKTGIALEVEPLIVG